jgi:hypothetical protein
MSLLLEHYDNNSNNHSGKYRELAEKIIYLAGHKVTNDPIAIPHSKGRNLLCIHR